MLRRLPREKEASFASTRRDIKMEAPFPIVSSELVSRLDEIFPPKEFSPKDDLRDMDYYFGQRNIINFLRAKNAEQTENILTKE